LVSRLVPPGTIRTNITKQVNKLPTKKEDRLRAVIREQIFPIQDAILRAFYAGLFVGGTSATTFDKVLDLIEALYCYVSLAPPAFPSTTANTDFVIGVVFPNSPTTTLVVPSKNAAVRIPTGAAPSATTVAIEKLPDSPNPLRTSLDQYPFFYHFSGTTASGPVTFNLDVTAGICLKDEIDVAEGNLRLAHNIAPFGFGDVEVLPTETPHGIDCSAPIGFLNEWGQRSLDWAEKLFLPAELHAAAAALVTGVGGTTKKFSEFGIVDIFSNPGSFSPVSPTSATEEGGTTVTRTVRVTSANGTRINRAPVTFSTVDGTLVGGSPQTVLTGPDGEASVSWILPSEAGDDELDVTVPSLDNPPLETTSPPSENVASFPDIAFDATSLIFTVHDPRGTIVGVVRNAFTGIAISGATITAGSHSATTASTGAYTIADVPAGTYDVTASAPDYVTGRRTGVVVRSGETTALDPILLAPAVTGDNIRIVLDWLGTPRDLDSHLGGPTAAGDRFHVFFGSPSFSDDVSAASLDRDDTDGFGPETITLTRRSSAGVYQYYVHNWSQEGPLTASGARVRVFRGSTELASFNVPTSGSGIYWQVFNLTGETITPVNELRPSPPPSPSALVALSNLPGDSSTSALTTAIVDDLPMIARDVANNPKPE
jgi:hypothetical protein